jgi:CMP-N,N'-diacetyllegionaminic acid synthase
MDDLKILCIIPARSGSKGVKHKNIKMFKGKPLLSWSIEQAKQCKFSKNMKIIVSTDSEKYAEIARKYGAEVPFLRPVQISDDLSTDYECIKHCIEWINKNEKYAPDIILQLRPTQPCRKIEDINECLEIFIEKYEHYSRP